LSDRPDTVVASVATVPLHLDLCERHIDVIMDHEKVVRFDSVVTDDRCDRLAGLVHERHRENDDGTLLIKRQFGHFGANTLACALERSALFFTEVSRSDAADIVARSEVLGPRIAESNDELGW
jgi:hypothetical protein